MSDRNGTGGSDPVPWRPLPGRRAPSHVSDSLDHLAATLGLGGLDALQKLFLEWDAIVGDDVARHCRPTSLNGGILVVRAVASEWAVELSWMTELIAERCNDALGDAQVTEVRISQ